MTVAHWRRFGRVLGPATPHLIRSMSWAAVPLSWLVAGVFLGGTRFDPTVDVIVVSMIVAGGVSFVVADAAAVTVASSPTARFDRLALRLALIAPAAARAWWFLLRIGASRDGLSLPDGDAWLLLATFVMVGLSAEMWAAGVTTVAGTVGVPTLLAFQVVALQLPTWLAVYPVDQHRWRWMIVLCLAVAAVSSALRDPARPARRRRSTTCAFGPLRRRPGASRRGPPG